MSWRAWVLVVGAAASAPALALEPDALFAKVAPSVWTVVASDAQGRNQSQGSAVVIGPGRLVTNCHVLARMTRFQVAKDNVSYGGKLEFPDPENDLCQIRWITSRLRPSSLRPGTPCGWARASMRSERRRAWRPR